MRKSYRAGKATVIVDDTSVRKLGDKITGGAISRFITRGRYYMDPIVADARRQWPKRTGLSKRSLAVRDRVTATSADVTAYNDAVRRGRQYGYILRFSVRTAKSMEIEAERFGAGDPNVGSDSDRRFVDWKLSARLGRSPLPGELAAEWRKRLIYRHGLGAPDERIAGKNAWSWLVRRLARRKERLLIEDARRDLATLARG